MTQAALDQTYQQAWSAEQQGPSGRWTDSTWDNLTFRVLLDGQQITTSGSTVWLTLKGRDAGSYTVERVSLVRRDGQTLNGVASTYREATFGSTWDAGGTVPAGGSLVSDPIPFDLLSGQDVFVTWWSPVGSPPVARTGGTRTATWIRNGTDESRTIDWAPLTINANRTYTYALDRVNIETTSGPVPPVPTGPVGQWVQTVKAPGHTVIENQPDPADPKTKWTVILDRDTARVHLTMKLGAV